MASSAPKFYDKIKHLVDEKEVTDELMSKTLSDAFHARKEELTQHIYVGMVEEYKSLDSDAQASFLLSRIADIHASINVQVESDWSYSKLRAEINNKKPKPSGIIAPIRGL